MQSSGADSEARPAPAGGPQGRLAFLVQVLSLIATGWLVWMNAISPRLHRYSWATLIGSALGYTIFACGASAAITGGLLLAIPRRERGDIVWGTLRTSAAAVWFAPAIILISQLSPASLAAALVLAITATRLLYSEWRRLHPPEEPLPVWVPAAPMFGEADLPRPPFLRELAPALAVALCTQAAITAFAMHARLLAAALAAMSAAMLTVFSISTGASNPGRPQNLPRSILGLVLTILLAAGLTVGGLRGRVRRVQLTADSDSGESPGQAGAPAPGPAGMGRKQVMVGQHSPPPPPGPALDGQFPGVILETEEQKVPMLVDPVPRDGGLFGASARAFAIVFEGEYWMYRFPYARPPSSSFLRKGSPAALSFRTPDHWPLTMEAHQKLDQPIDWRCCRTVKVEVWNADRYPGTIWLELLALRAGESTARGKSFGIMPVQSAPDLKKDPVTAVPETLEFPVPADVGPDPYSEIEVIFRRDQSRWDKSARVAITRFVLVPK